jgi:hypothetical protein
MKSQGSDEPTDAGRPRGCVDSLLYNRPADTLVAVMAQGSEPGPPVHRLYARRLPEVTYRPIGVRHELESQNDAHSCERAPLLIYNELRFRERRPTPGYLEVVLRGRKPPPEPWGADWIGVRRFDLQTGDDTRVLEESSLHPPSPYMSGRVSAILSVSADGLNAFCKVGLIRGGGVDYFVFEVSLQHGLRRMIAKLPNVFM